MSKIFATNLDMNQNQILNPVIHVNPSSPTTSVAGQLWFNNSSGVNTLNVYNGTEWISLGRLNQISAPTASVNFNSQKATGLADPVDPQDAVNLRTLEMAVQGLKPKSSVRCKSVANVVLTAPGTAIDGVTLVNGERVLISAQTAPAENGIYVFNGSAATMTRSLDASAWNELVSAFVFVEAGVTQADTGWLCTADSGGTLGTTAISWVQFSSAGLIEVINASGTGISMVNAKSGNQFPIKKITGATGITVADVGGVATVTPSYGIVANTVLQGNHHNSGGAAHAEATTSVAGFMSAADKTKLTGIATGANLYVHPNHTGDVTSTGDGVTVIATNAVTNVKLAKMPAITIKGNNTGSLADPKDLTVAEVRTLLDVPTNTTAVRKYSVLNTANVGATAVTHNLNNAMAQIEVFETATGNTVEADITSRAANSVTVTFSPVPVTQKYTIVVQG